MITPYLDTTEFTSRSLMPPEDVAVLETAYPGFIAKRIGQNQAWMTSRLSKRYGVFKDPVPELVLSWIVALTTLDAYVRRGFNPSSEQDQLIAKAADDARVEIKEAADSTVGLFELPMLEDGTDTDATVEGGPLGYSEASPYDWMDVQADAVRS